MLKVLSVAGQKTVHVLHNSEQPASVFAILESGSKVVPLIADGLFDLLMLKMTNIYTSKKQTKIESKGPRFEIGDFCVKLGSVTMSQNFKGVLVEVSEHIYLHISRKRKRNSPRSQSSRHPHFCARTLLLASVVRIVATTFHRNLDPGPCERPEFPKSISYIDIGIFSFRYCRSTVTLTRLNDEPTNYCCHYPNYCAGKA